METDTPVGLPDPTPEQALVLLHDAHVELLMLRRDLKECKAALREACDIAESIAEVSDAATDPRIAELRKLLEVLM